MVFGALDKSHQFLIYKFRTDGDAWGYYEKHSSNNLEVCRVPLKIKIFLQKLYNRKIQAGMVIKKRGWKGFGARERREK